jgi:hypothetical protein
VLFSIEDDEEEEENDKIFYDIPSLIGFLSTLNYMPYRMKVKTPCLAILSVTVFYLFLFRLYEQPKFVCLFISNSF